MVIAKDLIPPEADPDPRRIQRLLAPLQHEPTLRLGPHAQTGETHRFPLLGIVDVRPEFEVLRHGAEIEGGVARDVVDDELGGDDGPREEHADLGFAGREGSAPAVADFGPGHERFEGTRRGDGPHGGFEVGADEAGQPTEADVAREGVHGWGGEVRVQEGAETGGEEVDLVDDGGGDLDVLKLLHGRGHGVVLGCESLHVGAEVYEFERLVRGFGRLVRLLQGFFGVVHDAVVI